MSEFVSKYTSFWGVPVQSKVKARSTDRPGLIVSYEIEVLEGYDRILNQVTEVKSSIDDGGSCGIQLTMGVPQFLSAYKGRYDELSISSCTPNIPYNAIKNYLEKGVDANVPADYECFDEQNKIKLENTDCTVWEGAALDPWSRRGQEDWLDYLVSWRDNKTKALTSR